MSDHVPFRLVAFMMAPAGPPGPDCRAARARPRPRARATGQGPGPGTARRGGEGRAVAAFVGGAQRAALARAVVHEEVRACVWGRARAWGRGTSALLGRKRPRGRGADGAAADAVLVPRFEPAVVQELGHEQMVLALGVDGRAPRRPTTRSLWTARRARGRGGDSSSASRPQSSPSQAGLHRHSCSPRVPAPHTPFRLQFCGQPGGGGGGGGGGPGFSGLGSGSRWRSCSQTGSGRRCGRSPSPVGRNRRCARRRSCRRRNPTPATSSTGTQRRPTPEQRGVTLHLSWHAAAEGVFPKATHGAAIGAQLWK